MTIVNIITRILGFVIAQPGVQDFMTDVARRAVRQSTVAIVRAINNRSQLRKTVQTMK